MLWCRDPEIANENFRRIVDAYEILSDPVKRRRYDQTKSRSSNSRSNFKQGRQQQWTFTTRNGGSSRNNNNNAHRQRQEQEERRREAASKEEHRQLFPKAKLMQNRVWRVSALEEFQETILMKDDHFTAGGGYVYKKHIFLVFVGNKKSERIVDDELLFPYPFAGNGANGIIWDDVITTAKVRYNRATTLTRLFRVPIGTKNTPYIVFGKKGEPVGKFHTYRQTTSPKTWYQKRQEIVAWVQTQMLRVRIRVFNDHHAPVRLYRHDHQKVTHNLLNTMLEPGQSKLIEINLSDRLRVIDGRTDEFPIGGEGFNDPLFKQLKFVQRLVLLDELIVHDEGSTIVINGKKQCYDLSLNCHYLVTQDENVCDMQSEFMHSICSVSCGVCSEIPIWNSIQYGVFHYPIHKLPIWIQPPMYVVHEVGEVINVLWLDVVNVISERRNVAFCFLAAGLLIGWNLLFLMELKRVTEYNLYRKNFSLMDIMMLPLCVTVASGATLILTFTLREDFEAIFSSTNWPYFRGAIISILGVGCIAWNVISSLWKWTFRVEAVGGCGRFLRFFLSVLLLATFGAGVAFAGNHAMETDLTRAYHWRRLLNFRKNALALIGLGGLLLGAMVRSIVRMAWCIKGFLLQVAIKNSVLLVPVGIILTNDQFFRRDLDHVLQFRMTAAGIFTVVGLIVGPFLLKMSHFFNTTPVLSSLSSDKSMFDERTSITSASSTSHESTVSEEKEDYSSACPQ